MQNKILDLCEEFIEELRNIAKERSMGRIDTTSPLEIEFESILENTYGFSYEFDLVMPRLRDSLHSMDNVTWLNIGTSKVFMNDIPTNEFLENLKKVLVYEIRLWFDKYHFLWTISNSTMSSLSLKEIEKHPFENVTNVSEFARFVSTYINATSECMDLFYKMGFEIGCDDESEYIELKCARIRSVYEEYANTIHKYSRYRATSEILSILIELYFGDLYVYRVDDEIIYI